jgi:hypothetical protein
MKTNTTQNTGRKSCIVACLPREDGDFDVVAELKPNRGRLVPIMRENLDDRLLKEGLALYQFVFFKGDFFITKRIKQP